MFSSATRRQRGFVDQRLNRFVARLPTREPPHQFHQGSAHGPVAAAIDRAFAAFAITGVDTWTQSGVAGDLAAIPETRPVADLTSKNDPGQRTDATRQILWGRSLELGAQRAFAGIEIHRDRLPLGHQ